MLTHKPIGFEGTVCWKDSPDSQDYFYFSFSEELLNHEGQPAEQDLYGVFDEFIFFYLDDAQQESLHKAIEKFCPTISFEEVLLWGAGKEKLQAIKEV